VKEKSKERAVVYWEVIKYLREEIVIRDMMISDLEVQLYEEHKRRAFRSPWRR
jgi:hypothetical protein